MKNILFIHQSAEMYGSDKTLLILVSEFKKKGLHPIVVLPGEGPLKKYLEELAIQVEIAPVFKISRKMFSPGNILALPFQILKAFRKLDEIDKESKIDLVYSNTLAVLIGLLYARKKNLKHIWHVHEIIESPKMVVQFFKRALQTKGNTWIIYNSEATKAFWNDKDELLNLKSEVVHNGLFPSTKALTEDEKKNVRTDQIGAQDQEILIALVGRISRWKGQLLLLEAFNQLSQKHKGIRLLFVGSPPPNQDEFLDKLKEKITTYKLEQTVVILPFQDDIHTIWDVVDVAVVPSTEPEPFGLVAVEAMLASKPVVGANHGGLKEIIINNETGFLFMPNNVDDLIQKLEVLILDTAKRKEMGRKGLERARSVFSVENYTLQIEKICKKLML
ncbi:glycosyltransferase family 4 protein [Flavobacterium enshiense]|uniref:glycosyltransferase family 4 protein n=1 Tax=Flavobacterium enshiense TaxID=1341165 RepID=UPI00345CC390